VSSTHAFAIPVTEIAMNRSIAQASSGRAGAPAEEMYARAHCSALGAWSSAYRITDRNRSSIASSVPSVRSTCASPVAIARWRSSLAIGRAAAPARTATSASALGWSLVNPITEGMSAASLDRSASEVLSLTPLASEASAGWVQDGWSLHGSPARYDANSMKHAPLRGFRCLPADSTGTTSGE